MRYRRYVAGRRRKPRRQIAIGRCQMIPELMPISRCAEMAGLCSHELVLGVSPSDKHHHMLARYRRAVSLDAARGRVVADIRSAVKIGAARRAADLLIVLRWLLAPEASFDNSQTTMRPRRRILSARRPSDRSVVSRAGIVERRGRNHPSLRSWASAPLIAPASPVVLAQH